MEDWLGGAQFLVIAVGAIVGLATYNRDTKLRRAEWVYRLYQQFYESDRFKPIRRLIDYEPENEIKALREDIGRDAGTDLHEALVDYLNFFEFIAIQIKNKNLNRNEVLDMFDYYVRRLRDHDFLVSYIRSNGFENLDALLLKIKKKSR